MARRKMSIEVWAKALAHHADTPICGDYQGDSPGSAAVNLGVSRVRVHQFVKEGSLDILELYRSSDAKQRPVAWVITENSQRRLLASRYAKGLTKEIKASWRKHGQVVFQAKDGPPEMSIKLLDSSGKGRV